MANSSVKSIGKVVLHQFFKKCKNYKKVRFFDFFEKKGVIYTVFLTKKTHANVFEKSNHFLRKKRYTVL